MSGWYKIRDIYIFVGENQATKGEARLSLPLAIYFHQPSNSSSGILSWAKAIPYIQDAEALQNAFRWAIGKCNSHCSS